MEDNIFAYPTLLKTFLGLAQLASLSSNPGILGIGTAQALGFSFIDKIYVRVPLEM